MKRIIFLILLLFSFNSYALNSLPNYIYEEEFDKLIKEFKEKYKLEKEREEAQNNYFKNAFDKIYKDKDATIKDLGESECQYINSNGGFCGVHSNVEFYRCVDTLLMDLSNIYRNAKLTKNSYIGFAKGLQDGITTCGIFLRSYL